MTPQEIFNKSYLGMIAQGKPARAPDGGSCKYLTTDGLRCAVGLLIDDEMATMFDTTPELGTGTGINSCLSRYADSIPDWMNENRGLLSDLQEAHDISSPTNEVWLVDVKQQLQGVAEDHGLTIPDVPA